MKYTLRILVSTIFLFSAALPLSAVYAHGKVEQLMKDMGFQLRMIRDNDDKTEIVAALSEIQTLAQQAQQETPHVVDNGESSRTLEEFQTGMGNFIDKVEEIKQQVSAADSVDGKAVFTQIKQMRDQSHEYFSVD